MSASHTQMQEIAAAILALLKEDAPRDPAEVIERLAGEHDPWLVREAIWDLTASSAAELTWDRKLKLGQGSAMPIPAVT